VCNKNLECCSIKNVKIHILLSQVYSSFGGVGVRALASGTQVRGFEAVGFFRAKKSSACLPSEGK
jgi:hypothetical protein